MLNINIGFNTDRLSAVTRQMASRIIQSLLLIFLVFVIITSGIPVLPGDNTSSDDESETNTVGNMLHVKCKQGYVSINDECVMRY